MTLCRGGHVFMDQNDLYNLGWGYSGTIYTKSFSNWASMLFFLFVFFVFFLGGRVTKGF